MRQRSESNFGDEKGIEKVIQIDRINKVVKGGKRMSFRAFVITGDQEGKVGFGLGKSKEVPSAIKKGVNKARKGLTAINVVGDTIPHPVIGKFGSSRVVMNPARPGTGVIAGGAVKILFEALGLKDIVAKSLGKGSALNTTKAAMNGLLQLKDLKEEEKKRGKALPVFFHTKKIASSEENKSYLKEKQRRKRQSKSCYRKKSRQILN